MNAHPQPTKAELSQGIVALVTAMLFLPSLDAIAKGLAGEVSAGQIAWTRLFLQSALLLPFVALNGAFRITHIWKHAARGFLIAMATVLFFSAVMVMPLADAISIFLIGPLLLTIFSAIFLGEPIGWRRVLAVLAGFSGAMLIIQPSFENFGLVALLPLGTAISFAFYMVLTRGMARDGHAGSAVAMQFYAGVFGALTMSVALSFGLFAELPSVTLDWPATWAWGMLLLMGLIATIGHLLIVYAARRIDGSLIAPFQYLEIVSATTLGYFFFNDFPAPMTWLGAAIIVSSGLYIYFRERQLAARL